MKNDLDAIPNWPENQSMALEFRQRVARGQSFKNCYSVFGQLWQVKLFLGKEQRVLAQGRNGERASRFADMAIVHFLPYRKRLLRPLVDTDLNWSVAQANSDLVNIPEAKEMLVVWEKALLARSLIQPVVHTVSDESPRNTLQTRRDLLLQFHQLNISFERAKATLSSNSATKTSVEMMDKHMAELGIYVKSLDTLLANHVERNIETVV